MRTPVCDQAGIEAPIFAFSHCRDVVAAVSRAGGLGVLGTTRFTPPQLEIELSWLDKATQGKPYGIDLIFQAGMADPDIDALRAQIPEAHRAFLASLIERFEIPPARGATSDQYGVGDNLSMTPQHAREALRVALRHPVKLIASALGPVPPDVAKTAKARGILLAGLVGKPEHVRHHVASETDIIVATGSEAGGHCGEIGTMVLVPQIVAAAGALPVLAGGGITTGAQIVASLALGAQGVWTGSVWLPTHESDLHPLLKERLVEARSTDAIRSRSLTGKPSRQLRTPWLEAWEARGAPDPLPAPLQGVLVGGALVGAFQNEMKEFMATPVGQGIGLVQAQESVREVVYRLFEEYAEASERVGAIYRQAGG